jgi:hypothetical protein
MVESLSRVPFPVIYPTNAHKISLLDRDAMDVVIVFALVEIARDGADRLMRHRTPDNIGPTLVAAVADAYLEACKYAVTVLPRVRTGVPLHDDRDVLLTQDIAKAASATVTAVQSQG